MESKIPEPAQELVMWIAKSMLVKVLGNEKHGYTLNP